MNPHVTGPEGLYQVEAIGEAGPVCFTRGSIAHRHAVLWVSSNPPLKTAVEKKKTKEEIWRKAAARRVLCV
jgi:hypothetical protein